MSLAAFDSYMSFVDQMLSAASGPILQIDTVQLESVLVSHGVVLLYARMEQCFQEAIECKCNRCPDVDVRTFALSVKKEKTGKLLMESIKSTFNRFGIDHRQTLTPRLERLNISDSWDSVVNIRQRVAHHAQPASCTLQDLRNYYFDIKKVLGCIILALNLNEDDAAKICKLIEICDTDGLSPP